MSAKDERRESNFGSQIQEVLHWSGASQHLQRLLKWLILLDEIWKLRNSIAYQNAQPNSSALCQSVMHRCLIYSNQIVQLSTQRPSYIGYNIEDELRKNVNFTICSVDAHFLGNLYTCSWAGVYWNDDYTPLSVISGREAATTRGMSVRATL